MKLSNLLALVLFVNLILLFTLVPPTTARRGMSRRKMGKIKKIGAMLALMKFGGKRKVLIPIPIPIGLLKHLKKSKEKEREFFCEHHHQMGSVPKMQQFTSWPAATPEVVQTAHLYQPYQPAAAAAAVHQATLPIHQVELKSEPIIALPAGTTAYAIPITVHPGIHSNQHLVLSPEAETVELRSQPMVEVEQTVEPISEPYNEQHLIRNSHHYDRRARLQRLDYN